MTLPHITIPALLLAAAMPAATALATPAADPSPDIYGDSIVNLREISISATKQATGGPAGGGAVTTIGRGEIERLNIVSAKDAGAAVPNLFIPEYGSRITSSIYMRGLGARIDQPVMGMTIDNVPLLNKDHYDLDILDIERIQVLRGPQSTLYGRNTMGGVIDIRTLSPLSYQGTRLMAEYGRANSVKAGVSHYARPSRQFGAGGSLYYYRTDGFFKNLHNGENCDKERNWRATLKIAWKPSDRLILENMTSASAVRQGGYAYESVETREINYNDTCFYRRFSLIDGLTAKWTGENAEVASVTSYQYIDDNMTLDQDFLPAPYFTLTQKKREHALTQDIMVRSAATASRLRWLAGIFGFYKHADMRAPVTFKDYGISNMIIAKRNEMNPSYPVSWDSDSFLLDSSFEMPGYGLAAYGEAAYSLGGLTVVAGLRFDHESARLRYQSDCSTSYTINHVLPGGASELYDRRQVEIHNSGRLKRSFNQLLPKLAVTYELPSSHWPTTLRLSFTKGYKAGGFNTQMFSDVLQQELMSQMGIGTRYDVDRVVGYEPEKSWNYEIGAQTESPDGLFKANATLFYIDCRDQQLTVFPDGDVTGRIMTNAGRTRSFGAELSATWSPVERLTLHAGYGYTNARFKTFDNGKENYSGKCIPYAPQNTIFAAANYTFSIRSKLLRYISLTATASGAGKIYWNESNTLSQPFYAKLDASVRFTGERMSVDLWTKNLTATQYHTFYFVSIQHEFIQRGRPAQFGATLRIRI